MNTTARQSTATLVASGVIAAHVLDDNIVQPARSGLLDHLPSTIVPLAVIATLVVVRRRLRPGAQATGLLVLGLIGLMVASESLYDLRSGTLSGDDWTGLLAAAAGAFLLGLATRDLWRSRRIGGARWRTIGRRSLRVVGALLVTAQLVFPIVESYAITNAAVLDVPAADLGAAHEDVAIRTSDGLCLTGWYVPSRNGASVLVYPGRTHAQRQARMLIEHGYGVLLLDRRGTGNSDGEPNGYGWDAERDIHAAVDFLQQRDDVVDGRIGGLGLSVGGELMLQAAAESAGLRAVVSEGAGIRSIKEFQGVGGPEAWFAAPIIAMSTAATALFSNQMPPASLQALVPDIHVPVFFIFASGGHGGEMLSEDFYEVAHQPKQLWEIDGPHMGGMEAQPAEYERRVLGFFDDALLHSSSVPWSTRPHATSASCT